MKEKIIFLSDDSIYELTGFCYKTKLLLNGFKNATDFFNPEIYTPQTSFTGSEVFVVCAGTHTRLEPNHSLPWLKLQLPDLLIIGNGSCEDHTAAFFRQPYQFDFIFQQEHRFMNIWMLLYLLLQKRQRTGKKINQFSLGTVGEDILAKGLANLIDNGYITDVIKYMEYLSIPDNDVHKIAHTPKLAFSINHFYHSTISEHTDPATKRKFETLFPQAA